MRLMVSDYWPWIMPPAFPSDPQRNQRNGQQKGQRKCQRKCPQEKRECQRNGPQKDQRECQRNGQQEKRESPTQWPTKRPTRMPTKWPTRKPTRIPTQWPTRQPTVFTTMAPSPNLCAQFSSKNTCRRLRFKNTDVAVTGKYRHWGACILEAQRPLVPHPRSLQNAPHVLSMQTVWKRTQAAPSLKARMPP